MILLFGTVMQEFFSLTCIGVPVSLRFVLHMRRNLAKPMISYSSGGPSYPNYLRGIPQDRPVLFHGRLQQSRW